MAAIIFVLGAMAGAMLAGISRPQEPDRPVGGRTDPRAARATSGSHAADVARVIDGDTFEARVHVWPGIDITTKVRLRGIDAPELNARCREELVKAEAARDALQSILAQGGVTVMRVSPDKYGGRIVADAATRATPDISAAMLDRGLVRRYGGGRRDGWCG